MSILSVNGLHKSYGEGDACLDVINGLSFSLRRGECYGLLGPNGAGKTTTLKLCLGLATPDRGEISLAGHAVPVDARIARQRVGVVPQIDSLDPDFTVEENLQVYARYFGLRESETEARMQWLLDFASLTAKRHSRIAELSGGMKRRLMLARALVNDPDLIFMDEPTTGLDPQARHLIWERLKSLLASGKTILLTTHFMDEAERLCDRLGVLDHGRMIAEGAPHELIAEHIEPQVLEVYGDNVEEWAQQMRQTTDRMEISGDTVFCYVHQAEPLLQSLTMRGGLRYLHRPANLEDLFLKLTGREMRD
jgi:lipooligosaccharide transport system ATP-binding protein